MSFCENLSDEALSELFSAYGNYICEASSVQMFFVNWNPPSIEEFYENEYKSVWTREGSFKRFFADVLAMTAKDNTAPSIASALVNFYLIFEPEEYLEQTDLHEKAKALITQDLANNDFEYILDHLRNDMADCEVASLRLVAKLLIIQLEQFQMQKVQ